MRGRVNIEGRIGGNVCFIDEEREAQCIMLLKYIILNHLIFEEEEEIISVKYY